MRLATGGCDNLVKIWRHDEGASAWVEAESLPAAHTDWVRDVAWAPTVGGAAETIASCSQDKKVVIWTRGSGEWALKTIQMSRCAAALLGWRSLLGGSALGRVCCRAAGGPQNREPTLAPRHCDFY